LAPLHPLLEATAFIITVATVIITWRYRNRQYVCVPKIKVAALHSDVYRVSTAPRSQAGGLQARTIGGAAHTVAYDKLAQSSPLLQLI
jgi:hypothetical protein